MYNKGSAEFNNLIEKSGGQSLKPRLVFDDFIIENIIKLEYYGGSNNSDDITIGTTTTSYVDAEIVTDKVIVNQEFLLEAGFLIDGEYEYAPIGYFTIQLPEVEDDNISFKAYDRMQKLEKPYNSSLQFPTNDSDVVEEICTKCGIQVATPIVKPVMVNEMPQGYTCREILGYIAGIHGFFACFDRYGRLNLRWYEETPIEKSVSVIWSLTKEQKNHTISKVVMARDSETIYTSGNGITSINTSNPLATQQIADNVYNSLNGYSYRPANISMLDDIRIDPWDTIKIVYFDGNTYIIPAMVLEHSFSNCETKITAVGKSEIENEYSYTGPIVTALERTQTELLVANRVIATKVDAEWVQANTITVGKLEATNARVGVLEANSLTVTQADLKYANIQLGNIDIANINKASIGNLFAEVGLLTSAVIQNGHVTGYLDSVEVNANSITAGTLITDRLVFRGQQKSIVYELNNITGALQSVQSNTLNGEILTDRSITVDKIVAHSITANEIAASTITANNIAANAVTADKLSANAVTTAKLAANAVTTDKLSANAVTANKIAVNSLSAISANLGTVKIGGSGNGNGTLEIYDSNNKLFIKGDNTGLATTKMINIDDNSQYIVFSRTAFNYGGQVYAISGIDVGGLTLGKGGSLYDDNLNDGGYIGNLSKIFADNSFDIIMGNSRYNLKTILSGYYGTPDNGGIAPVKAKFYGDVSGEEISGGIVEGGTVKTSNGANLDDINNRLKNLTFYADTATTPSATGSYKAIRTLPSGFTVNNTYIIAIMIQRSDTAAWQAMDGQISAYIADTHLYVYVGNSFWANRPMKILFARR